MFCTGWINWLNPGKIDIWKRCFISSRWHSTSFKAANLWSWGTSEPSFILGELDSCCGQVYYCAALVCVSVVTLHREKESSHCNPEVKSWQIESHLLKRYSKGINLWKGIVNFKLQNTTACWLSLCCCNLNWLSICFWVQLKILNVNLCSPTKSRTCFFKPVASTEFQLKLGAPPSQFV